MKTKNRFEPWVFILPAIVVYVVAVIIPVIWSLVYSFFNWKGIEDITFSGVQNYQRLFHDSKFITSVTNNLFFMAVGTITQIFMGLLMATLLFGITHGSNIFRVMYFIPSIISSMAICKIFEKLLSVQPEGLIAAIVKALGGTPKAVLSMPQYSLLAVTLVDAYKFCGLYMVIFYSAFMSIDQELIEASFIDGCTWFQQYIHIRLPLIKPILITALIIVVNGTLKAFDVPYILTNGGPGNVSEVVATYMYKVSFNSANFGYGSTISMFLLLESLLAVGLIRWFGNRDSVNTTI